MAISLVAIAIGAPEERPAVRNHHQPADLYHHSRQYGARARNRPRVSDRNAGSVDDQVDDRKQRADDEKSVF